jgi:hypothetical protein
MCLTSPHYVVSWPRSLTGWLLTSKRAAWRSILAQRHRSEAQLPSNYLRKTCLERPRRTQRGAAAVNGGVSRQCDITIAEPSTPPFWDEGDYRIVPAECVYGVIEVKASLDSTELEKAWRLIADVKALPKTADFPNPPNEPQRRAQRTASISSTS